MKPLRMVIAGGKFDEPDVCRLKLHEEYGRVWLYVADAEGRSLQNGRLLCIDDDGELRIACKHRWETAARIFLELPTPHADAESGSVNHKHQPAVPIRGGLKDSETF